MLETFQNSLLHFSRSSLEESKGMAFLNRFDTKYVLKTENAFDFLENIQQNYSLLQINDDVIQSYKSVYFDTKDLLCFNMHHNKRANRFKFRTRHYKSNGKIVNEIKQKLNTGKTIKFRKRRDIFIPEFDSEFKLLADCNGYKTEPLIPQLYIYFNRITLLNKHFPERMTLDFDLKYQFNNEEFALNNTAILELKRDRSPERTAAQNFLRKIHKNPSAFSKYVIGISLTHAEAKKNRFLPRIKNLSYERRTL